MGQILKKMLSPSSPGGSCLCCPPWLCAVPWLPLCVTFSYSGSCSWLCVAERWSSLLYVAASGGTTPLEDRKTRWLSAQWCCSYGNRPRRHKWCAPNCNLRQHSKWVNVVMLQISFLQMPWELFNPQHWYNRTLFSVWSCGHGSKKSRWMQRRRETNGWKEIWAERERDDICLLLCSFISCLPFNWISHLHVWEQPGSDWAHPAHNDRPSLWSQCTSKDLLSWLPASNYDVF